MAVAALLLDNRPKEPGATVEISTQFFDRFSADLRGMDQQRFVNVASLSFQTNLVRVAVDTIRKAKPLHKDDEEFLRKWLQAADLARKILDLEASGWSSWFRKRQLRTRIDKAVRQDAITAKNELRKFERGSVLSAPVNARPVNGFARQGGAIGRQRSANFTDRARALRCGEAFVDHRVLPT